MGRQYKKRAVRNPNSAPWKATKLAARTLDKAASGLFRWATTDHSGIGRALKLMPRRGDS